MANDINGGLRNVLPGPLDSLRGPYDSLATANGAIPSVVVGGKNFREGKFVEIGANGMFETYWWSGSGQYLNSDLVKYVEDPDLTNYAEKATVYTKDQVYTKPQIDQAIIGLSPDSEVLIPIFESKIDTAEKDAINGVPIISDVPLRTTIEAVRSLTGSLKSSTMYTYDAPGDWNLSTEDTTSLDDGVKILVDLDGRRWIKQLYNSNPTLRNEFGFKTSPNADNTTALIRGIDFAVEHNNGILTLPAGKILVDIGDDTILVNKPVRMQAMGAGGRHANNVIRDYATSIIDMSPVESSTPLFRIDGSAYPAQMPGVELKNIAFCGNGQKRRCFDIVQAGWELNISNVSVDYFPAGAFMFDKVYDSNIINLTITRSGMMVDGTPRYAIVFDDTSNTDNTNAFHFINLHMEFQRYYMDFKRCRHIYFSNTKVEVRDFHDATMNGVDTDLTNPHIIFGNNAREISFDGGFFVARETHKWQLANPGVSPDLFPYLIRNDRTVADVQNSIMFSGTHFTSANPLEGSKLIDSGSIGNMKFSNCDMQNIAGDTNSLKLKNCKISDSSIFVGHGLAGNTKIPISLEDCMVDNVDINSTASLDQSGIAFEILGSRNKIREVRTRGFKSKYSLGAGDGGKYSSYERSETYFLLNDAKYLELMGVAVDFNNVIIDLRKIDTSIIKLKFSQAAKIKQILGGFIGEKVKLIGDDATVIYTLEPGGNIQTNISSIRGGDLVELVYTDSIWINQTIKSGVLNLTTNYTVKISDFGSNGKLIIYASAVSSPFTVTMEASARTQGYEVNVIKTDSSTNAVTIKGSGSETINGSNTRLLSTQFETIKLNSTGTQLFIV